MGADLSQLPPPPLTVEAIYREHERRRRKGNSKRLGASELGHECSRFLWYRFRWAAESDFPGRIVRLLETGDIEEERVIKELRSIGVEVLDRDPETGKQWWVTAVGGHVGGFADGALRGIPDAPETWHLLEVKSSNLKQFARLRKEGVRRTRPKHWGQIQTYMGELELSWCLYLCVCKDNDELYQERIAFDPRFYQSLIRKAHGIITSPVPPSKVSHDPIGWPCGFCDFLRTCHEGQPPAVNCRTCVHSTPELDENARWSCALHGHDLTREDQAKGCDDHLFIPPAIGVEVEEPVDAGEGWVLYRKKNGKTFLNATPGAFPLPEADEIYQHRRGEE